MKDWPSLVQEIKKEKSFCCRPPTWGKGRVRWSGVEVSELRGFSGFPDASASLFPSGKTLHTICYLTGGLLPDLPAPPRALTTSSRAKKWCVTSQSAHTHTHTLGNFYILLCIPFRWWRASVRLGRKETAARGEGGDQRGEADRRSHPQFSFRESIGKYYAARIKFQGGNRRVWWRSRRPKLKSQNTTSETLIRHVPYRQEVKTKVQI